MYLSNEVHHYQVTGTIYGHIIEDLQHSHDEQKIPQQARHSMRLSSKRSLPLFTLWTEWFPLRSPGSWAPKRTGSFSGSMHHPFNSTELAVLCRHYTRQPGTQVHLQAYQALHPSPLATYQAPRVSDSRVGCTSIIFLTLQALYPTARHPQHQVLDCSIHRQAPVCTTRGPMICLQALQAHKLLVNQV